MKKSVITFGIILFITAVGISQETALTQVSGNLTVYGTSNLHDWDVKAEKISGSTVFTIEEGSLKTIDKLNFSVVAESLKSGKSGMDKNTYAALNTKTHKNITYRLTKVSKITETAANTYKVETTGELFIAGITKNVVISFTAKISGNKLSLSGIVPIDMIHYGIEPPKALMGSIKTGKDVRIEFNVEYK